MNGQRGCSVFRTVEMKKKPTLATRNYSKFCVLLTRMTYPVVDYVTNTAIRYIVVCYV